ncbi:DUF4013 domain-containing protein [Halorussus caseinilyticus]|uniref:DUF4013 domain-containing protein n=1 Tax=Halorussus caseinilyticus TaxID=3034025 RepID=A0ABD5WK38_9EURY
MLRESLSYPARTDEETLLVGTILVVAVGLLARLGVLAALAVVPAVLLVGYVLAVLRATAESSGGASADADAPPEFSDLRALAADGARALAVTVGYLLVPAAALAVTVGGASAGARPESLGTTTFVFGAGTVVLFVSLAFAYLLPAALVGVARTGELAAAMDRGRLRGVAGGVGTSSRGPRPCWSAASVWSSPVDWRRSADPVRSSRSRSGSTPPSWSLGWWAEVSRVSRRDDLGDQRVSDNRTFPSGSYGVGSVSGVVSVAVDAPVSRGSLLRRRCPRFGRRDVGACRRSP